MAKIPVSAGCLIRGSVRRFLTEAEAKFDISWKETKSLLESTFLIEGDEELLNAIGQVMNEQFNS